MDLPDIQLYSDGAVVDRDVLRHSVPFTFAKNCFLYARDERSRLRYSELMTLIAYVDQEESSPGSTYLNSEQFQQMLEPLKGCVFFSFIPGKPEILYFAFEGAQYTQHPKDEVFAFFGNGAIGWSLRNQRGGPVPDNLEDTHYFHPKLPD